MLNCAREKKKGTDIRLSDSACLVWASRCQVSLEVFYDDSCDVCRKRHATKNRRRTSFKLEERLFLEVPLRDFVLPPISKEYIRFDRPMHVVRNPFCLRRHRCIHNCSLVPRFVIELYERRKLLRFVLDKNKHLIKLTTYMLDKSLTQSTNPTS